MPTGVYKRTKIKRTHQVWNENIWDDGFIGDGRFLVHYPTSSRVLNRSGSYAFRYHVVYERKTGMAIPKHLVIHHKNGNSLDDRFENLQLMTVEEHSKIHAEEYRIGHYLNCLVCGIKFYKPNYRLRSGHSGKYCSKKCRDNRGTNR